MSRNISCTPSVCLHDISRDLPRSWAFVNVVINIQVFFFNNVDWGSSSALCPLEVLQPVWLIVRVLNVPTLAARCLSRPQPAVVP